MPIFHAPLGERVHIFSGGPIAAHTGVTTESAALLTLPILGGMIGPNGLVQFIWWWEKTGTAGTCNHRAKLNGTTFRDNLNGGTAVVGAQAGLFANRNSESSQIALRASTVTSVGLATETAGNNLTMAHDTSTDKNITLTLQLANAADSVTIQWWLCRVIHGD